MAIVKFEYYFESLHKLAIFLAFKIRKWLIDGF